MLPYSKGLLLGSRLNTKSGSRQSRYSTFRSPTRRQRYEKKESCTQGDRHTCYRLDRLRLLSSHQEDNVSLTRVDIVVLKEEDSIDAIFLECAEFDKQSNCTGE